MVDSYLKVMILNTLHKTSVLENGWICKRWIPHYWNITIVSHYYIFFD